MPTLTIRGLSEATVVALKRLARQHHRSMEQEVRTILEERVADRSLLLARVRAGWDELDEPTPAAEVEAWIRETRARDG